MSKKLTNDALRPVGARALKSAMDTLRFKLENATVLDLYAGQGRFGLESVREGAARVVFVEKHRATLEALKKEAGHPLYKNCKDFQFIAKDVLNFLDSTDGIFDVVFADPPFPDWEKSFSTDLLTRVVKHMKSGSILLVKHPVGVLPSSEILSLSVLKTTVFGESVLTYFTYGEDKRT